MFRIFFNCIFALTFITKSFAQDSLVHVNRTIDVNWSYVGESFNNLAGGLNVG